MLPLQPATKEKREVFLRFDFEGDCWERLYSVEMFDIQWPKKNFQINFAWVLNNATFAVPNKTGLKRSWKRKA